MKKILIAVLFLFPLSIFASPGHVGNSLVTSNLGLISEINNELNNPPKVSTQSASNGTNKYTILLKKLEIRQAEFLNLARQNPSLALQYAINNNIRSKQPIELQNYIEQEDSLSGTTDIRHVDDFNNHENSKYEYRVNDVRVYTTEEIGNTSGQKVTLTGYRLNANEFLRKGTASLQSPTNTDIGATGKQRTLVLLVNSSINRSQPISPKEAEDYINNGQFQKFIKEASYGQTYFEAKAYGWITLPNYTTNNPDNPACGYGNLSDQTIKNYLAYQKVDLKNFDRVVFLVPTVEGGCSSVGKSVYNNDPSIRLSTAWIGLNNYKSNSSWGEQDFPWSNLDFLLAHELGHSLGLLHANGLECKNGQQIYGECLHVEYGNTYDAMGTGKYGLHYEGSYKEILGWIKPENILQISKSGTYTLNNLEDKNSKYKFAKITQPNLTLGSQNQSAETFQSNTADYGPRIYLDYKSGIGFDSALNKLNIEGATTTPITKLLVIIPKEKENAEEVLSSRLINTKPSNKSWYENVGNAGIELLDKPFTDKGSGITVGPIIREDEKSSTFVVKVDKATCVYGIPAISTAVATPIYKGGQTYVSFSYMNNDSVLCNDSKMKITPELPDKSWSIVQNSPGDTSSKPQHTKYGELKITAPDNAESKWYLIPINITNLNSGIISKNPANLYVQVLEKPIIESVVPEPAQPGVNITINGKNFPTDNRTLILSNENYGVYETLNITESSGNKITASLPTKVKICNYDGQKYTCQYTDLPSGKYAITLSGTDLRLVANISIENTKNDKKAISEVALPSVSLLKNSVYPIKFFAFKSKQVDINLVDRREDTVIANIETKFPVDSISPSKTYPWHVPKTINPEFYRIKISDSDNPETYAYSSKFEVIESEPTNTSAIITLTEKPTAKIIYDTNKKESQLEVSYKLNLKIKKPKLAIYKFGQMSVLTKRITPSENQQLTMMRADAQIEKINLKNGDIVQPTSDYYSLPITTSEATSIDVLVKSNFNPRIMFPGQYSFEINENQILLITSNDNKLISIPIEKAVSPDPITIIGETSPYIYSVSPENISDTSDITINGERFSTNNEILLSSNTDQSKYSFNLPLSPTDKNKLGFNVKKYGIPPGGYYVSVKTENGDSNRIYIIINKSQKGAGTSYRTSFVNTMAASAIISLLNLLDK
jgi:hypothetical protein